MVCSFMLAMPVRNLRSSFKTLAGKFTCGDNSSLEIERSYLDVNVGYSF